MRRFALLAPLFLTAACSTFPAAQMRLPGNLAAEAERQPFTAEQIAETYGLD